MSSESVTFLIDVCLRGKQFRAALLQAGLKVERLEDHFPEDCPDVEWIPLFSEPPYEWIIVTMDYGIFRNPLEMQAANDSRARLILFADGSLSALERAERFLRYLPDIQRTIENKPAPFVIIIHDDGLAIGPP